MSDRFNPYLSSFGMHYTFCNPRLRPGSCRTGYLEGLRHLAIHSVATNAARAAVFWTRASCLDYRGASECQEGNVV